VTEEERNKARIRALLSAVDAGELETAMSFFDDHYYDHDTSEARRSDGSHRDELRRAFGRFYAAFTGTTHRIDDMVAEGDKVAVRISVSATHTGEIFGIPPTGRVVHNDSLVIYRFKDGRIRERWCRERQSTRSLITS
jgi:predicted ester cyclase